MFRIFVEKLSKFQFRTYSKDSCPNFNLKGLVLGVYNGCETGNYILTDTAERINEEINGRITELIEGLTIRRGTALVLRNIHKDYKAIAIAGLGDKNTTYNNLEHLDECKESIRIAAGVGAKELQDDGIVHIAVENFTNAECAAEGATLATWIYQDLKTEDPKPIVKIDLFNSEENNLEEWQCGVIKAEAQNTARRLEETPSNFMTPLVFAQAALDILTPCGVQVAVRDKDWLETKRMSAFLSMTRGSCEPPLFLEIGYCGGSLDDKPFVLVGKGITFDSGGTLKKYNEVSEYRGDMAGAAVIVGTIKAIAQLSLPINVQGLIPLCENMPGGMAMKPGDVVTALNGKTIRLEDTDNEGRVCLADALVYANDFKPCLIINIATLTSGIRKCLGAAASGVFSTSSIIWRELDRAASDSGDRVWRFPFWKHYQKKVTDYVGADINNVGKENGGNTCLGAAFLREFIPPVDFVHMDITGTGLQSTGIGYPYLSKGLMTGRPTRTLIQLMYQLACPHYKGEDC